MRWRFLLLFSLLPGLALALTPEEAARQALEKQLGPAAAAALLPNPAEKKAAASPSPSPRPSPSPSPKPSPSAVPAPVAAPAPSPMDPALPLGVLRSPWEPVPLGAAVFFSQATLTISKSNQIGMKGALVRNLVVTSSTPLVDPSQAGDSASLVLLNRDGTDAAVSWYLMSVEANVGSQRCSWQRLVDMSDGAHVTWMVARTYFNAKTVKREETWKEGSPDTTLDYDESGRVLSEFHYAPGAADSLSFNQRTDFRYRDNLLVGSSISDASGKVLEQVDYAHTLDGRIRQTEKRYANGKLERYVYRYDEAGLSGSWANDTDLGQSWFFDAAGRLLTQEEWKDGKVAKRVTITWADAQGSRMASRETLEPATGHRTVEAFDEQGRVVQIDEFVKTDTISQSSQEWNQDGRLVLRNTVGPKGSESWLGEYDGVTLVSERYSKNGVPVKVVTRQGDECIEEIYLDGVLRLRAWYFGTEKYKEEDIRNGQVYRTRTFSTP